MQECPQRECQQKVPVRKRIHLWRLHDEQGLHEEITLESRGEVRNAHSLPWGREHQLGRRESEHQRHLVPAWRPNGENLTSEGSSKGMGGSLWERASIIAMKS